MNCVKSLNIWKHSWVWDSRNPRKDPKHGSKSLFVHKKRKLHRLHITVSKSESWPQFHRHAVLWSETSCLSEIAKIYNGKRSWNRTPLPFCFVFLSFWFFSADAAKTKIQICLVLLIHCKYTLVRPTKYFFLFFLHQHWRTNIYKNHCIYNTYVANSILEGVDILTAKLLYIVTLYSNNIYILLQWIRQKMCAAKQAISADSRVCSHGFNFMTQQDHIL